MEDGADAARGALDHATVPDVAADHLEPSPGLARERQVGAAARREIVEHADARAVRQESLDEVGADEPRAARHEKHVRHW